MTNEETSLEDDVERMAESIRPKKKKPSNTAPKRPKTEPTESLQDSIHNLVDNIHRTVNNTVRTSLGNVANAVASSGNVSVNVGNTGSVSIINSPGSVCASSGNSCSMQSLGTVPNKLYINSSQGDVRIEYHSKQGMVIKSDNGTSTQYSNGIMQIGINQGDATIYLPRTRTLELEIKVEEGDIEGEIANKGRLIITEGDVNITVTLPLEVMASAYQGDLNVRKMQDQGNGQYKPPTKSVGKLRVEVQEGDIDIEYV